MALLFRAIQSEREEAEAAVGPPAGVVEIGTQEVVIMEAQPGGERTWFKDGSNWCAVVDLRPEVALGVCDWRQGIYPVRRLGHRKLRLG